MNTLGDFLLQRDQRMANPRSAASSSVSLPLANIATALPRAPHQQAPHMERGGGGGGSGGRHGGADDKRQHGAYCESALLCCWSSHIETPGFFFHRNYVHC